MKQLVLLVLAAVVLMCGCSGANEAQSNMPPATAEPQSFHALPIAEPTAEPTAAPTPIPSEPYNGEHFSLMLKSDWAVVEKEDYIMFISPDGQSSLTVVSAPSGGMNHALLHMVVSGLSRDKRVALAHEILVNSTSNADLQSRVSNADMTEFTLSGKDGFCISGTILGMEKNTRVRDLVFIEGEQLLSLMFVSDIDIDLAFADILASLQIN